jgi:hypothetical protein
MLISLGLDESRLRAFVRNDWDGGIVAGTGVGEAGGGSDQNTAAAFPAADRAFTAHSSAVPEPQAPFGSTPQTRSGRH